MAKIIQITCKKCGDKFSDYKTNNRYFCSSACSASFNKNSLGHKHSPETRKKISEANKKRLSNEKDHPQWRGNEVSYRSLHKWVQKWLGKPNKCSECGKIGYGHQIHWANLSGEYQRILSDWIRLCSKCHGIYDREMGHRKHIKK